MHLYLSVGLGRPLEGLSPRDRDRDRTFRGAPAGSCLEENHRGKERGPEAGSRAGHCGRGHGEGSGSGLETIKAGVEFSRGT